ncbi:hypothetical protein OO006_09590 [Prosthecochloris sp. SCSIO W1101]|uniref:hypothetical protein n=1 Tax=Prosthecochloris sp. SCSIO W1101 TaxID=2992242 RepID=UPI00223CCA4F|nr:hypothetical protein [Prosthecochloris sp. SCSIO W1101]UZJ40608.1 hypothetical protein OO006_09590 [Prosthecochloris sp. SCSIO W1101]
MKKFLLPAIMIMVALIMPDRAYTENSHDHHNHDGHHAHKENGFHIGLSIGWVHLKEEGEHHEEGEHNEEDGHSEDALGVHLHIGKRLADEGVLSKVSLGIGGEVIFSEEEHYGLSAYTAIHPWKGLKLAVGPAVEWSKHDDEWESHYSTHMEVAYGFDVQDIHIGPSFGYSTSDHGEHYSVGIHVGYHL